LFPVVTDSDAPQAISAGPLYFHFGHFLLESPARAWYAHQHPDVPFVWAGDHTWQGYELRPWQSEVLDILTVKNPTRIIADPVGFEVLHVPDIGYRYDDRFHPEHALFLGCSKGHPRFLATGCGCRSKINSDVRDLNSAPTERRLAEAGWIVTDPQTLSMSEQLGFGRQSCPRDPSDASGYTAMRLFVGRKDRCTSRSGCQANQWTRRAWERLRAGRQGAQPLVASPWLRRAAAGWQGLGSDAGEGAYAKGPQAGASDASAVGAHGQAGSVTVAEALTTADGILQAVEVGAAIPSLVVDA
jgi:hypothetical protein